MDVIWLRNEMESLPDRLDQSTLPRVSVNNSGIQAARSSEERKSIASAYQWITAFFLLVYPSVHRDCVPF